MTAARIGRVQHHDSGLAWRVVFPDSEHAATASFLRDLVASDCSPATARSYAYALLRWLRFLHDHHVDWDRAEQVDVRAFVEHLREVPNLQQLRRRPDSTASSTALGTAPGWAPGTIHARANGPARAGTTRRARSTTSSACCSRSTPTPAPRTSAR